MWISVISPSAPDWINSAVRRVRGSALVWVPICVITLVSAATRAMIRASCTVLQSGFWQ